MKNKLITTLLISGTLLCSGQSSIISADSYSGTSSPQTNASTKTLIITAKGETEGSFTPYIQGLPFTGNVTLHYTATNSGFVDGDESIITIKLPEEFKYAASAPDFKSGVSGKLQLQGIFGQRAVDISPDMVDVYPDRILIQAPHTFWIGVGEMNADININYGKTLTEYPSLPIVDAPEGYSFTTQLQYSSAMWDFIKNPIFGTDDDTYITEETSAIAN